MAWGVKIVHTPSQEKRGIKMLNQFATIFVDKSESINWKAELKSQKINWKKLIKKSEDFCTCAVGHQSSIIPRTDSGVPSFKDLEQLGYDFMDACEQKNAKSCLILLKKIEKVSLSKTKECISRVKKIFKKNPDILQKYLDGNRYFGVSVDKDGSIINIKDVARYFVTLSDDRVFVKDEDVLQER